MNWWNGGGDGSETAVEKAPESGDEAAGQEEQESPAPRDEGAAKGARSAITTAVSSASFQATAAAAAGLKRPSGIHELLDHGRFCLLAYPPLVTGSSGLPMFIIRIKHKDIARFALDLKVRL